MMLRLSRWRRLLSALLPVVLLLSACGTARKSTPSQRFEYRIGQAEPESDTRRSDGKKDAGKPAPRKKESEITSLKGKELIDYARKFIGTPYRYGANGPDRFDCSGFTTYVYKHFGIQLPRNSRDQFTSGKPVRKISQIQPGDLIFFARSGKIFHVGMAVEAREDHFTFIHASTSAGVIISRSDDAYWAPKYYGAKRIFD